MEIKGICPFLFFFQFIYIRRNYANHARPTRKNQIFYRTSKRTTKRRDKDIFLEYLDLYLINPTDFIHEDTHIDILELFIQTETALDELTNLQTPLIISNILNYGVGEEFYYKWKNHPTTVVRWELARRGYFPDHFLHDKELSVQLQILDKHHEYLHYFTKNSNIVTEVYQKMSLIHKPELQDLLDFRETCIKAKQRGKVDILDYKISSYREPTPLEATMTLEQLYLSDNSLWAKNFDMFSVALINCREKELSKEEVWKDTIITEEDGVRRIRLQFKLR